MRVCVYIYIYTYINLLFRSRGTSMPCIIMMAMRKRNMAMMMNAQNSEGSEPTSGAVDLRLRRSYPCAMPCTVCGTTVQNEGVQQEVGVRGSHSVSVVR